MKCRNCKREDFLLGDWCVCEDCHTDEIMNRDWTLGGKIRWHRKSLGLQQKELAVRAQVSGSTICRIESGEIKDVHSQALKRIARVLDVSMDELMRGGA